MPSPSTPKIVVLLVLGALAALLLAGCGGGSDADSDPQELLDATFGGGDGEQVSSGVLDISVTAGAGGNGGGSLQGSIQGPFETRGDTEPPLVDVTAALEVKGGGQNTDFEGGLTITDDAGFVTADGQAYEVDQATYDLFLQQFAQSAETQDDQGDEGSALFEQLGIDPSQWLTDVTNEGTEEVGGAETVHISGTADVVQIFEDAQAIDPTGSALGAAGSSQLAEGVEAATVDVYTGADDNILRRLDLTLELADPGSSGETLSVDLSIGISDVNEEQTFEAPADAKPLEDLLPGGVAALGGQLDALGGGGGGQGGGGAADGVDLGSFPPEYQQCVSEAKSPDDFAACNDLLAG